MATKSAAQVKRELEQRLAEIERHREDAKRQKLEFSCLDEKALLKKIKRMTAHSPYIFSQAWTGGGAAGSAQMYEVQFANPDPGGYFPFFVTIYFGPVAFVTDLGAALAARDSRWPALSSARLSLNPGVSLRQRFDFAMPAGLQKGTYHGNSVIWEGEWHDRGTPFDRGLWDLAAT